MASRFDPRPQSRGLQGVYRATIQKIDADGRMWVQTPRLSGGDSVGPLPTVVLPRPASPGDRVLVQAVEGMSTNLIVVALLANH